MLEFTHLALHVCSNLGPIIHFVDTMVLSGLPRVSSDRNLVGETEMTCSKSPVQHDFDAVTVAVALIYATEHAIFCFEELRVLPP